MDTDPRVDPSIDQSGPSHCVGLVFLTRWEIQDTNGDFRCGLQVLMPQVDVIDAGNGLPLVVVPYWIACDGLAPTELKLIMVYQDKKYAIRGTLPNQEGDQVTRSPGGNFGQLPPVVQKTALAYWEKVEAAVKKADRWNDPNASSERR